MASDILAKKQKIGIIEQANWATPASASSAFKTVNYDANVTIPEDNVQTNAFNWTSANGLTEEESRVYTDGISGLKRVPFSGVMTKALLAPHLYAAFLSVTEAGTTPYAKDFTLNDTQPDFAGNDVPLWSVAVSNYDDGSTVGDGMIIENCIIDNLTISVSPLSSGLDKLVKMSGAWVGNEVSHENFFTGDHTNWVAMPTTGFYNGTTSPMAIETLIIGSNTLTQNGAGVTCFRNYSFSLNNNVQADCPTTGGKANQYKVMPVIDQTLDIPFNSATYKLLKSYKDGDSISFEIKNGSVTVDGGFGITTTKGYLTANPFVFEGDYMAIRLQFRAIRPTAGWGNIIQMADTIDWTW